MGHDAAVVGDARPSLDASRAVTMGTWRGAEGAFVRGRWFGIPALFIVVFLATGTNAFGALITAPEPDSHVATVKKAGFSIAVPDAWAEIDLTKKQAAGSEGRTIGFPGLAGRVARQPCRVRGAGHQVVRN